MDTTTATTNRAQRPLCEGTALPEATATALAAHLLGDTIASTPDIHEAAAAQVGDVLVVEAVYEVGHDWTAVRFEMDQAGDFTESDALELISVEAEPVCRCGALFCDDCRGSVRRAS